MCRFNLKLWMNLIPQLIKVFAVWSLAHQRSTRAYPLWAWMNVKFVADGRVCIEWTRDVCGKAEQQAKPWRRLVNLWFICLGRKTRRVADAGHRLERRSANSTHSRRYKLRRCCMPVTCGHRQWRRAFSHSTILPSPSISLCLPASSRLSTVTLSQYTTYHEPYT